MFFDIQKSNTEPLHSLVIVDEISVLSEQPMFFQGRFVEDYVMYFLENIMHLIHQRLHPTCLCIVDDEIYERAQETQYGASSLRFLITRKRYDSSFLKVFLDQYVDVPNVPFHDDKGFYLYAIEKIQKLVTETLTGLNTSNEGGKKGKLESFKMKQVKNKE